MATERKMFKEMNEKGEMVNVSKKEIYSRLLELEEIRTNELYSDFIKYQIELLDRKTATRGSSKSEENEKLAETLYNLLLKSNAETTISEILQTSEFSATKGYTSPKIAAILKILVDDDRVEKTTVKRKNYYKAVAVAE